MVPENLNVKRLFEIVSELTRFLQASGETDFYYFHDVHEQLLKFSVQDWDYLKNELLKWHKDQLRVLVIALDEGDGDYNTIEDNFFIGYIFTFAPFDLSISILYNYFEFFFDEHEIYSVELLDAILTKINLLYENDYIPEEQTHKYWTNYINVLIKKAVC